MEKTFITSPQLRPAMVGLDWKKGISHACDMILRRKNWSHATWKGNFRDFNAAVMRMATFSGNAGRIGSDLVQEEIERLKEMEKPSYSEDKFLTILLGNNYVDKFDDIELCQLKHVLSVCRSARSLSEAGRTLYNCSRLKKTVVNDADRLKKFLKKFDLTFERICEVNMR